MKDILIGALLPLGISGIVAILGMVLKRENTYKWGITVGKILSPFFGKAGKKQYEKFEGTFQTTIYDFCMGIIKGLDADDETKWKEPEN